MLDVFIHVWPEVALTDTAEGAEGVKVASNRVSVEGNKDDVPITRKSNWTAMTA